MSAASRIASMIVNAVREGPDETDRDFFMPPQPEAAMTIEAFRETALEVLRKEAPFPAADRLEHIRSKGLQLGLNVDDRWLSDLLREAEREVEQQRLAPPPSK